MDSAGTPPDTAGQRSEREDALVEDLLASDAVVSLGTAGGIPVAQNETVGRSTLVAEAGSILRRPDVRLLTLTGLGGVGKTRVASEVAANVAEHHGEVSFVPVPPESDAATLATEIARALGHSDETDSWAGLESLLTTSAAGPRLVVLDGLDVVDEVTALLQVITGPGTGVDVLVTSRLPLGLPNEVELRVTPLEVPGATLPLPALAEVPSVRLFLQRAEQARPGFSLAGAERAVSELCRMLDGLPLALELAAARLNILTVDRLKESLQHDLSLLTTGASHVPARQQALGTTIAWSYDRLDDAARGLCDRLALFRRSFSLESAEAVCPDVPDVLGCLGRIVDARLVRVTDDGASVRFELLSIVRTLANDRLGMRSDLDLRRRLLAEHLRSVTEARARELDGPECAVVLRQFDDDAADLSVSIHWGLSSQHSEIAAQLVLAAVDLWMGSGRAPEGVDAVDAALTQLDPASLVAGRLHGARTKLSYSLGDFDAAVTSGRAALSLAELNEDEVGATIARCFLGAALLHVGDRDEAAELSGQAFEAGQRLDLYPVPAQALSSLAMSRAIAGDFEGEREHYQRRLEVVRRHEDVSRTADTLNTLAEIALDEGDPETAMAYATEALAIIGTGFPPEQRDTTITRARAALQLGQQTEAAAQLSTALELSERTGQSLAMAQCLRVAACLALSTGDPRLAVRLFAAAEARSPSHTGTGIPPEFDLAETLRQAREASGEQVADREWTLGSAMPPATIRAQLDQLLAGV